MEIRVGVFNLPTVTCLKHPSLVLVDFPAIADPAYYTTLDRLLQHLAKQIMCRDRRG
jgi:hypothetical protein